MTVATGDGPSWKLQMTFEYILTFSEFYTFESINLFLSLWTIEITLVARPQSNLRTITTW